MANSEEDDSEVTGDAAHALRLQAAEEKRNEVNRQRRTATLVSAKSALGTVCMPFFF